MYLPRVFEEALKVPLSIWKETESFLAEIDENESYIVYIADENDLFKRDKIKKYLHSNLVFYQKSKSEIFSKIRECFKFQEFEAKDLNSFLDLSVILKASDLHFNPKDSEVIAKARIDGILHKIGTLQKDSVISNQLKLFAGLDIAESRRPQSGSFDEFILGISFNLRVSTHPTIYGENIVVRFLEKGKTTTSLDNLGFTKGHIKKILDSIKTTQGLIICSGPTGSGKTTSLYTIMSLLDQVALNIMTLEDPVEYYMEGINQTSIQDGVLSFFDGLKSILRQDPDVILVGEIRDSATAKLAIQAALTGHLVFATIHAKDNNSVIDRLKSLDAEIDLIQSCLKLVISQRLIRKICKECNGFGCKTCLNSGFLGRTLLVELSNDISMQEHAKSLLEYSITTKDEIERVMEDFS